MIDKYNSKKTELLISIPHSSEKSYKWSKYLKNNFDEDVDHYVHKLIDIDLLLSNNITIIKSDLIRTVIDLNRSRDNSFFHWTKNTKGEDIYNYIPECELYHWDEYYKLLDKFSNKNILLIDLHSMPSVTTSYHRITNPDQNYNRPDICISDCELYKDINSINDILLDNFENFNININDPYIGGNIIKSMKSKFRDTIQIEINRKLYMNEETKVIYENIDELKNFLTRSIIQFKSIYSN